MAGPRSYKPQTGVRFPQLRQTPRAAVVRLSVRSEIAPLHGASPMGAPRAAHFVRGVCNFPRSKVVSRPLKPVTLVRFQLGEPTCGGRCVLECTPRCERGSAGSIPAGHPASNNWVWVNGWPPGPEPGPRRFDSCRPDRGSRPTEGRGRSHRWNRGFDSLRLHGPVDYSEMSAPPQGAGPGSTPGRVTTSHWSTRRRMPDFQSGERGSTPRWDTVRECCRMVGNRSRKPGWW